VDVEDWNNTAILALTGRVLPPTDAVVRNTETLLALFAEHRVQATWFVLGEVAEAFPHLVREIAAAGHELGVHGYHHHRLFELTPAAFRTSIHRAKEAVEQAGGQRVLGHRAVAFSLSSSTWWALEILVDLGFEYDSSVFPFRGTRYGLPHAPLTPYRIDTAQGSLTEVPLPVLDFGPLRLPCGGGGYLRHFPLGYTRWAFRTLERRGRRVVSYLHPYEVDLGYDADYFRCHLTEAEHDRLRRLRWGQYRNRAQTMAKLHCLLRQHRFGSMARMLAQWPGLGAPPVGERCDGQRGATERGKGVEDDNSPRTGEV
jgi:polysaccharide deacetylase family protein (PEP-CTERM system associated)